MIKKIVGLFTLVLFTTLTSCSSDDGGSSTANASLSATIDGQAWNSISGAAVANITSVAINGTNTNVLQIIAASLDQSALTLQFPINSLTEGTYTFSANSGGQLSYVSSFSDLNVYSSADANGSFTVTISEVDAASGAISGTFSGTLVDFMGTETISVTNGVFNSIDVETSELYSNGSMSLSKDGGSVVMMDDDANDGKFIWILQGSMGDDDALTVMGYNTVMESDFGIYSLTFPLDVAPGTYDLTDVGFDAQFGGSNDQTEYTLTSGSMTVISHNGNTIVAEFNYTVTNGSETVVISQGALEITHN